MTESPPSPRRGWIASVIVLLLILATIELRFWPFNSNFVEVASNSFWLILLSDRITMGILRLMLVSGGLYVILSIPVLILHNRWIVSVSSQGVRTEEIDRTLDELKRALEEVTAERDEYMELLERYTAPRSSIVGPAR